jgi:hypothetical protein
VAVVKGYDKSIETNSHVHKVHIVSHVSGGMAFSILITYDLACFAWLYRYTLKNPRWSGEIVYTLYV